MRLNSKKLKEIADKKGLENKDICTRTGLTNKSLEWILENGHIEASTCKVLADAVGCSAGEILSQDYTGYTENAIEWVKGQSKATLSLSQRGMISKVLKLAKSRPEECEVVAENQDGSICAHVPVSWIKITPARQLTEEQRRKIGERLNGKVENAHTTGGNLE